MDWMGFDWDGDGYVEFGESMITFAAFRMIQLQRQNQLMQHQIDYLRENPDFIDDLPIGWEYGASYYPSHSRSSISLEELFNPIGNIFSRFFRFIYSLLVSMVRGWILIFQIGRASFNKLIQMAGFTKLQVIFLSVLVVFTMIIFVAIGVYFILTSVP